MVRLNETVNAPKISSETLVLSNMSIMPSLPNIFDPNVLLSQGLTLKSCSPAKKGKKSKTNIKPKSNTRYRYDG